MKKVPMDKERLEAAGLSVESVDGGAMIGTKTASPALVRMDGDDLVLILERSALHRQINTALGGTNPKMPSDR